MGRQRLQKDGLKECFNMTQIFNSRGNETLYKKANILKVKNVAYL